MEWEEGRNQTVMAQDRNRVGLQQNFMNDSMMNILTMLVAMQVIGVHYYACELLQGAQKRTAMNSVSVSAINLMTTLPQLIGSIFEATQIEAPLRRIGTILDTKPTIEPEFETVDASPPTLQGEIQFKGVAFHYPAADEGTKQALLDISFKASPGENIALVGPIGCGKSTIMKLLEGFYRPDKGEILIDGTPIEEYNLHMLRRGFAVVAQESVLLGTTLREAITYGLIPPPSDEVVKQACVDANAWEFINEQKDGLHSRINCVGGVQLSGGQKQCIAIARALIRKPVVLLLDEATSSLDTISEKNVQDAITKLRQASVKTTITIAHRLQTVMSCDQIFVVADGTVVESGTHAELTQKVNGVYQKLWDTQSHEDSSLAERVSHLEKENDRLRTKLESMRADDSQQPQPSHKSNFGIF